MTQQAGSGRITSTSRDFWPLLRLIVLLIAAGAALYATAGPPRPPADAPDLQLAWATLRGSSLPLDALAYVLSTLAWVIWFWLCLSLVARLLVALTDLATQGAAWVSSLRRAIDAFTLPFVRRAVDSALAVAIVVQVVARPAAVGAAGLPQETPVVQSVQSAEAASVARVAPRVAMYSVQRGDTLWTIAERFYGTGEEFPRLVDANVGRTVADGQTFPETGVIEPGWQLHVPLPSTVLEEEDGETVYTVERGDTLWGISARFLGDPFRWPEIYESNRESASLPDGRTLRDPDLIWPQLRLHLPMSVEAGEPPLLGSLAAPPPAIAVPLEEAPPNDHFETAAQDGSSVATVMGGAAGMGAAGAMAAALFARRRGRRGLDEPPVGDEPESDHVVRGGFADLEDITRGRGGPDEAAAHEVLRYFDERGLAGRVGLVTVRHGRSGTTLAVVSQRLADRPRVVDAASGLATRLGVDVRTHVSRDHDVLLRLGSLRRARFDTTSSGKSAAPCRLLPVGVLPDRRVLSINWPAVGHVLLAGHGRGALTTLLSSLAASLAVRVPVEGMHLVTFARPGVLPSHLARLPHQVGSFIDPGDHVAASAAMHDVRAELVRRMERVERGGSVATLPELVVLVPELERLLDHLSTLDILGSYGPAHRVRLLAATARSQDLPDELVAHFAARGVLRVADERESARLLGSAAATDLLGGGQLLLRLDQREPIEAYAFRVSEPELDRAVRMLRGETMPSRSVQVAGSEADWPETLEDDDSAVIPTPSSSRGRDLGSNHEIPRLRLGMTTLQAAIDVRCFGGFDVLAGASDLTAASSPADAAERAAAWELLAFLGSQAEGVAAREDVLLALWPGQDSRQAVASLHATMERLNGLLEPALSQLAAAAPPVTLDSRDGTVRLDLNRVESDVHQFLRLCRAASLMPLERALETWAQARELYRGDLLDGPGARAHSWVTAAAEDGELSPRAWLREQFYRATLRQARLLVQSDRVAEAIPLFHALLDVEPLLEDVVRDLYRCHSARGDLAALIAEDERLRQALRLALGPDDDLDPEPATAALFAELREELEVKASVTA